MKTAIIHDWLVSYAGAERVLAAMIACFPQADLFSLIDFLPTNERVHLQGKSAQTSFIQRLPFARTQYRAYLPLMPLAVEQFDLSGYDLVLSSSHAVAKGVITGPDQLHISYVHTPIRYAWDLQHQYLRNAGLDRGLRGWAAKWLLHRLRQWDHRTASGVDAFIANSGYIARRITKTYRRRAQVIYPPVDTANFTLHTDKADYYLAASRLVPYKKMPLIIEAFRAMPDQRLVVIGDGPEREKCMAAARGCAHIQYLGWQPSPVLREQLQKAKALIFAAEEDFGILPVEAQACGTPVIGFARGGLLETVRGLDQESPTGVFFEEQSTAAIIHAVQRFEQTAHITAHACRENALRFAPERFHNAFKTLVDGEWARFQAAQQRPA